MKAKKKLLAIALSAVTGVSAFGLALHLTSPNTVSADGALPYTVTNLEDLVDSGKDIRWVGTQASVKCLYQGEEDIVNKGIQKKETTISGTTYKVDYAIYDRAYAEGDKLDKFTYTTKQKEDGSTVYSSLEDNNVVINANKYDGNYSFFLNETNGNYKALQTGLLLSKATDRNQVISFNMNYIARSAEFFSRYTVKSSAGWYGYPTKGSAGSWYGVFLNHTGGLTSKFLDFRKTTDTSTKSYANFTKDQLKTEYNSNNPNDQVNSFDELLVEGNDINVTYGTYDDSGTTWMYFRLYNLTQEKTIIDKKIDTGELDVTDAAYESTWPGLARQMKINFQQRSDWDVVGADRTPVTIAGVEEPLLGYDYTVEEGTYTEDNELSSVTLPAGYEWVDTTQTLQAGTHEYDATYTTEYYGVEYTKDCKITVTAEELPSYTLTLKDMSGEVLGTRSVKQGESYTFESYAAVGGTKTFVAYVVGENTLYKEGESILVNGDGEATLWEVDFTIADTASVRLIDDGTNYGGIRWTMNIDAAAYDVIKNKVSVSTMIIPTDLIEGDLEYNEAEAEVEALDAAVLANGTADFAITNIRHFNYNRPFSGTAFMEVAYASGAGYVYAEAKSFSVYELACDALAEHYAKLEESDGAMGKYSANGVAMLEKYIAGVIDLTVTDDGTNLTVAGSTVGDGVLLGDLGYVVTNATQAKATEGKTTVTISITVDPNSALASLVQVGAAVPVIVRNATAPATYKAVEATAMSYENNTLTISVKI